MTTQIPTKKLPFLILGKNLDRQPKIENKYFSTAQTVHFKGLNALRFLAALSIIIYHSTAGFHEKMSRGYRFFFQNLVLGVDFFFLISGFLIIYLLLLEKQNTGRIDLGRFYLRRALRIFPLYFLIVGLAYLLYHNRHTDIDFSKYLYFWGDFYTIEISNWPHGMLTPLWSVCIEEQFYLVIPLLVWVVPLNRVHWVLLAVISAGFLFRYNQFPDGNWFNFYCHPISRCDLMALGGLIAVLHLHHPISVHLSVYAPLMVLGALLVLIMISAQYSDYTMLDYALFKKYLFAIPVIGVIVLLTCNTHVSAGIFEHQTLQYLGKISYGLYMFHGPVNDFMLEYSPLTKYIFEWRILNPLQVFLVTLLISALSYAYFEKQFLRLKFKAQVIRAA